MGYRIPLTTTLGSLRQILTLCLLLLLTAEGASQIALLGDNAPHANLRDGDFNSVWTYWRTATQSPFWETTIVRGKAPMGLHYGTLFSSNAEGIATTEVVKDHPEYPKPAAGDVWNWSFGADLEYTCKGTISLSLVFGGTEKVLAEKVKLIGSDKTVEHFRGVYTLSKADANAGFPKVKVTFYSEHDVKVYLDYVNISVRKAEKEGPQDFAAAAAEGGIQLSWTDTKATPSSHFQIYRKTANQKNYVKLGVSKMPQFLDSALTNGVNYTYLVTRMEELESGPSRSVTVSKKDQSPPLPPTALTASVDDTEIALRWKKSEEEDVAGYSLFRGDARGAEMQEIAQNISGTSYEDFSPAKGVENTYLLYAHDYSGNRSLASEPIKARVKAVRGASFRDLILPIPKTRELRSDVWGAANVLPRDPQNGMEHPDWSYWGGHPIKGEDGNYHMYIARWPEKAVKGHWEWPNSTVAHVVSTSPLGPYEVKKELAYSWAGGKGHNPDITPLNDGSYLLHLWQGHVLHAPGINGPWTYLGDIEVNYEHITPDNPKEYQYFNNLTGVQREDGSFLFMTKFGKVMESKDILGPYEVLTTTEISEDPLLPKKFQQTNYEDPTIWRDEVQYHCLINAFIAKRAIYLRSPDGINWKFDPGIAYDPNITSYSDGTRTHWYKLERPHVLQDAYGRATHLSLAALDVPKRDDLAGDKHNSKNIIIPLVVHRRLKTLSKQPVSGSSKKIKLLLLAEPGFDPLRDVDISSLRYGAAEAVNFGEGAKVLKTKAKGKNLLLVFNDRDTGFTSSNFAGKLLGKTTDGSLLIGFAKLGGE